LYWTAAEIYFYLKATSQVELYYCTKTVDRSKIFHFQFADMKVSSNAIHGELPTIYLNFCQCSSVEWELGVNGCRF